MSVPEHSGAQASPRLAGCRRRRHVGVGGGRRGNAVGRRGIDLEVSVADDVLPLAVLDFVGIEHGESPSAAIAGAVSIAQAAEAAGYRRYWVTT